MRLGVGNALKTPPGACPFFSSFPRNTGTNLDHFCSLAKETIFSECQANKTKSGQGHSVGQNTMQDYSRQDQKGQRQEEIPRVWVGGCAHTWDGEATFGPGVKGCSPDSTQDRGGPLPLTLALWKC